MRPHEEVGHRQVRYQQPVDGEIGAAALEVRHHDYDEARRVSRQRKDRGEPRGGADKFVAQQVLARVQGVRSGVALDWLMIDQWRAVVVIEVVDQRGKHARVSSAVEKKDCSNLLNPVFKLNYYLLFSAA